ncbi:dynein axonemal heavy chain 6 [Toxorhynchites rutilus septentrionalis]|uniref:dynein axonemal heavy chain 6 n=1 Tax=Toxorhynchites rutilus septentrionalis TaxID=329112 RepID=UPI00247A286A|nr:dynein axonemal heavy chain 6 [Toxorhynchites rutilus septentrionalis]
MEKRQDNRVKITQPKSKPFAKLTTFCQDDRKKRIVARTTKLYKPTPINIDELIEKRIRRFRDNSFVFLTYAFSRSSERFGPYSFLEVPFSKVDKHEYYTISRHGITYWSDTENIFSPLDEWIQDYSKYKTLTKLNFFRNYRKAKALCRWRLNIKRTKYESARQSISSCLFLVMPRLSRALLYMREQYVQLVNFRFFDVSVSENWHLPYFVETQMTTYEQVRDLLFKLGMKMKEVLYDACCSTLVDRGYSPQDEALNCTNKKMIKEIMSFTERANKRKLCALLARFLGFVDHMMINLLHQILRESFRNLSNVFKGYSPQDTTQQETRKPFMMIELHLAPTEITVDPSRQTTVSFLEKICTLVMESTRSIQRFQSDPYFNLFTEPVIMGRKEDRLCGAPPSFNFIIENDLELMDNMASIHSNINTAFDTIDKYLTQFDTIRENYQQALSLNREVIRGETDLDKLRAFCHRYNAEMAELDIIQESNSLGLLLVKQSTFREQIIPVCQDILSILDEILPKLALEKINFVEQKGEEITTKLLIVPEETSHYIYYFNFLEICHEHIDNLERELNYAYEALKIMKIYKVPFRDEDKDKYLDMEELVTQMKDIMNLKRSQKVDLINKFDLCLQTDIARIFSEVEEINEQVLKEWLLDVNSDPAQIRDCLIDLSERLTSCQRKAQEYRKYQKEFRLEVTRFEKLDHVINEVKLRQTLWDSVQQWNESVELWSEIKFKDLNVEEIEALNTKVLKNCAMLDKNLPKNEVIPRLKLEAEVFKEKIPVLSYLRNPALKNRHWIKIEQILNRKFTGEDDIYLHTFEDANAFEEDVSNELMEVANMASAEAGLETILNKVESAWKDLELSIVSHRDARDVFILAGTDDIQTVLDESCINISTIAASRHVGPIKAKVDEWGRLLDLFSRTLDEWILCQQSWIYLEAIFSAPDIQRQLPHETQMFLQVDKSWKDLMRRTQKTPMALTAMTAEGVLEKLQINNVLLEKVTRCLEAYLDVKRMAFPRFYFLSNDELLEILAQTKNPHAVQPHLRKCFDAIAKIEFGKKKKETGESIMSNDIIAMVSPEGERLTFGVGLKARGAVEDWLSKVEEAMFLAVKRYMRLGYRCYPLKDRSFWMQEHPNQIVLTVSQQQWCADVHSILDSDGNIPKKLGEFKNKLVKNLAVLASIARTNIAKLVRKVLCALITIDVHAMDTICHLMDKKVSKSSDFEWLKMLRYYWITENDTVETRMASANLPYFYEYLGAGGVLVITPLTDRCYLCLMGALQMDLGGAPAGPAGTGKTETTKDLAKALAIQCVVFNCSDGLDYKMMGRFFTGLAQSGAWCCFDEFNRIDIEVLSVIAQQLITIRNAKAMKMKRFIFEGREIRLKPSCAAFITMNPGYAGRTELPDNLKALFRPISMMVPDYALIAEVILYSEGFEASKILAKKMVQLYKLCSEQLSQQDHYDFGMRAVKSVLVMAGALKRASPEQSEDITLICALRDSNLPKFLANDAILFKGIMGDLFPGIDLPEPARGSLQGAIEACMNQQNLQIVPELVLKTLQLYETMVVRWGVMLVGPTGNGKTSVLHTLARALEKLYIDFVEGPQYKPVNIQTINPKAISMEELYGYVNLATMEWKDGLLGLAIRTAANILDEEHQWVVCDGPVDAVWIENLNTVLDDNKMLCLANSERIKLSSWVHMIFEVQDLAQASPATVSRCGMVYLDPLHLGWSPLITSWLNTVQECYLDPDLKEHILVLFKCYFEEMVKYINKKCRWGIHQVYISKLTMMTKLMLLLLKDTQNINLMERGDAKSYVFKLFAWCAVWSLAGNLLDESKIGFEKFLRSLFREGDVALLPEGSLWDYRINTSAKTWENWIAIHPQFEYNPNVPYFDLLVPTLDTTKYGYVAQMLFNDQNPVMFTGDTGAGKSVLARDILNKLMKMDVIPIFVNFSAQSESIRTQEIIESRLERRKKTLLGAPINKRIIIFIDDVNMPKLDVYGSQPPIELLRQFLDCRGVYDRDKMYWKGIVDVTLGAACAPPGGGRNVLTPRFIRHFALLSLPTHSSDTLKTIFKAILTGFLSDFSMAIRPLADSMVEAAVAVYERISEELLPTPKKSHYIFNLRDLSKCIQGILQSDSSSYVNPIQMLRLFYHESLRIFYDRLVCQEDKSYFIQLLQDCCEKYFETTVVHPEEKVLFGDFMVFGQATEDRIYEEIKDSKKLKNILIDYLEEYNSIGGKEMNLIFFTDAIEHIVRLARLLRSERGNGLLVGVSGMGKQSLSRLAAHINGYQCSQIALRRGYDHTSFHEDLRKIYWVAGVLNKPIVFLITDTQIVKEEFMEDINNILNSGEVPNLFEGDEYEKIILNARQACIESGYANTTRDGIFEYFIKRVRTNLHVIICMSPVGDIFRRRCRMFPSLVNCCTIDWYVKWPAEALLSVAVGSLNDVAENEVQCRHLAQICVMMHESVENISERFYREMRRHYYTTPSSYLQLFNQYRTLVHKRINTISQKKDRIANGLSKILETNQVVVEMGEELKQFVPILEEKSRNMKELLAKLDKDNSIAEGVKRSVAKDEAEAKVKATETQEIADEAAKDLETVMPTLQAAQDALKALNKNDINELRVFQKPPKLVQFVMEAVLILLGAKTDWNSAKVVMADVNFLKKLEEYDKEHIPETVLKKLKSYVDHKDFQPPIIEKVSKVAKSMCLWVIAVERYAKVYRVVEPKIKRQKAAEDELNQVMQLLKSKQNELAEIEAKILMLVSNLEEKKREMKVLQDHNDLTAARLNRAGRLTSALADEEIRWRDTVKELTAEQFAVPGDVLVASAYVAYLGAFPMDYRRELCKIWVEECRNLNIPSSDTFSLVKILGDSFQIRQWNMFGLPRDDISVENAIISTQGGRWPLMIDPQEQANRWIRNMEAKNELRIIKLTDANMMRILEICIRKGTPMLIEDIYESLDPVLESVLLKRVFLQNGRFMIKLGDVDIDYDSNFRLYMTTKLANPHFLPEICIQVSLVNFLVSRRGLEDQLLADIIKIELPEMENQRSELIVRINADKQQLLILEDKVLKLLYSSQGNILDDEELVDALNESKETSLIIADRLVETEKTEMTIAATREKYRILASRGAVCYFVVSTLAEIDPMYQFSLRYFTQVYCSVIARPHEKVELPERLRTLLDDITFTVFSNMARGLLERHKVIFAFLLTTTICKETNEFNDDQLNFILRGPSNRNFSLNEKPAFVSENQWINCKFLKQNFENLSGLTECLSELIVIDIGDYRCNLSPAPTPTKPSVNWNEKTTAPEKLLLIAALKVEDLVIAITEFIRFKLGKQFTEPPQNTTLPSLYEDISQTTPLVFILSPGSDPMTGLIKFAQEREYGEKLFSISLGQGQGPAAESLIELGVKNGYWIFLQNCHLATSWMESMEKIVNNIALGLKTTHNDFRLYLSSMPVNTFPISVLQNSVKVTNEPPKGLRANLIRSLNDLNVGSFELHVLGQRWRNMIFGLCMFHGVILERRKFGPLGWNITYEFNESDRECALRTLDIYCDREIQSPIPWAALEYINGEITYGGRVTDSWDQRCLRSILKIFSSENILSTRYQYSESGMYYCPDGQTLEVYKAYANNLPIHDPPEIFGMHENANIIFNRNETQFFVNTLLNSLSGGDAFGEAALAAMDKICMEKIQNIRAAIAKNIITDNPYPDLMKRDNKNRVPSLTTVLLQEIERFDRLLSVIHVNLNDLEKAIQGFIVMSESLETIYRSFTNNQVPQIWHSKGFLSTKTLGSWIFDLQQRIEYIQSWFDDGLPISSWICGLFFPQSFLTGTLQTFSRKNDIPIDTLKFDFDIMSCTLNQQVIYERQIRGQKSNSLFEDLKTPESGILIHGLFIEAGRWDLREGGLCDPKVGELVSRLPVVLLKPCIDLEIARRYEAPLYKTSVRAGVLSTTGHSTNFVLSILLPSMKPADFWILRGTALITMIAD